MNQFDCKQSSLLFIQKEYASTIKLLHEEIKSLQMKNSELLLQLTMEGTGCQPVANFNQDNIEKDHENSIFSDQIKSLKEEIRQLSADNESKLHQIENYEATVCSLTRAIEELKMCQHARLKAVEMELNTKKAEIVNLTTKLHNWKTLEITKPFPFNVETLVKAPSVKPVFSINETLPSKTIATHCNQISVHTDDQIKQSVRKIYQNSVISKYHPIKSCQVSPIPENASITEGLINFPRSIRRPVVLPPINSVKTQSSKDLNFGFDPRSTKIEYTNNLDCVINSHSSVIDIDRIMEIKAESSMRRSTSSIVCDMYRNSDFP